MMKPSHLAPQGAGLLGRGLRETAESLAAGLELHRTEATEVTV